MTREAKAEAPTVEVYADRLEYEGDSGWVVATGRVRIRRGEEELQADRVRFHVPTEDIEAYGHVTLRRGQEVWTGEELRHNLRKGIGAVLGLAGRADPFRIQAERSEVRDGRTYIFHRAWVTTCQYDPPHSHYRIYARKVLVTPGEHVKAWDAVWYLDRVPVLYLPFWHRTLQEGFGFSVVPGYDSQMGAFLLSSYKYRLTPEWDGRTHLDLRSRRGVGLGQDLRWRLWDTRLRGDLKLYYAEDRDPRDPDDPLDEELSAHRYRARVRHRWSMGPRDEMWMQADVLSDPDVLEDFFEDEYRRLRQPDNFVAFARRGDGWNVGGVVRKRLNDFYRQVERCPEITFDVERRPLWGGDLYYETQNSAAWLRQVWERGRTEAKDYDAIRLDSRHALYYPRRFWGFVNWVPRGVYRGTYYSATLADGRSAGGSLRSAVELGQEVSFQAWRIWPGDRPWRHLVEPLLGWVWVPEPTISPDRLYQFDEIDTLERRHALDLGLRNRLQRKVEGRSYDVADVAVTTAVKLYRAEDEPALQRLRIDADLRPTPWLRWDMDGAYDLMASQVEEWNTRVRLQPRREWALSAEHRFRVRDLSLLSLDCTLFPDQPWTWAISGRHELRRDRLEELSTWVQRNLDCMSIRGGGLWMPGYRRADGSERNDEWRVILELWLTAFPETRIGSRYRR